MTDPGPWRAAIQALPGDVSALCEIIQGLLLHDAAGRSLYGTPPAEVDFSRRTTLALARRLDLILAADPRPLSEARAPFQRSVGTCRDFALMLCAVLREQGTPARLRCGFADYLGGGRFRDHWVCEYGQPARWDRDTIQRPPWRPVPE